MIHGILMSKEKTLKDLKVDAHIAVLHTKVNALEEKQKELTQRVRANEKVVAAVTLLGTVALAVIGAGYFAPKAEACSPRLDGKPTFCPNPDDPFPNPKPIVKPQPIGITDKSFDKEFPDAFTHTVTLYDTRDDDPFDIAHIGHDFPTNEWIQKIRDHESRKTRTNPEDSINKALEDMEFNNGSNGSTEQKELLQLPSDGDQ